MILANAILYSLPKNHGNQNGVRGLTFSMTLSGKQKKYLRGLAHGRPAMVSVGGKGLTDSLLDEIASTLGHHELLKIKLPAGPRLEREKLLRSICAATQAETVQLIGRMGVIFRASDPPEIELP